MDRYRVLAKRIISLLVSFELILFLSPVQGSEIKTFDTLEKKIEILEKEIPGFGELFRWLSYKKIATSTIQSRAMAGVTKGTNLFSLPGSVGACKDAWDDILVHQLDYRHRPCNLVELMPRLREHEEDQ